MPSPGSGLLGRWVDAAGSPITQATVGETVRFQVCVDNSATDEVQGVLGDGGAVATRGTLVNLTSDAPSGVHPDCSGSDDQLGEEGLFFTIGAPGEFTSIVVGIDNTGIGPQGVLEAPYTLNSAGTLQPTVSITLAEAGGVALTVTQDIAPLTVIAPAPQPDGLND